jgi:hypothetical protein
MEGNVLAKTESKAPRAAATLADYVVRHNPLLYLWLVTKPHGEGHGGAVETLELRRRTKIEVYFRSR